MILSDSGYRHFFDQHNDMSTTYTIAELAREFDITARAIRFYEDQGLLSPMREGQGGRNRVYTPRDRTRLKLTLRGKRLGLTLSEIKSIIDMYESPKDTVAQINRFLAVLAHQKETLEQQRADIEMSLAEIAVHEDECKRLLMEAGVEGTVRPQEQDAA